MKNFNTSYIKWALNINWPVFNKDDLSAIIIDMTDFIIVNKDDNKMKI